MLINAWLKTVKLQMMLYPSILDFIGNTPAGFSDQSDAIHPVGFPIMTIINACFCASSKFCHWKCIPSSGREHESGAMLRHPTKNNGSCWIPGWYSTTTAVLPAICHIVTQVFGHDRSAPVGSPCFLWLSAKRCSKANHLDVSVWPLKYRDLIKLG